MRRRSFLATITALVGGLFASKAPAEEKPYLQMTDEGGCHVAHQGDKKFVFGLENPYWETPVQLTPLPAKTFEAAIVSLWLSNRCLSATEMDDLVNAPSWHAKLQELGFKRLS